MVRAGVEVGVEEGSALGAGDSVDRGIAGSISVGEDPNPFAFASTASLTRASIVASTSTDGIGDDSQEARKIKVITNVTTDVTL